MVRVLQHMKLAGLLALGIAALYPYPVSAQQAPVFIEQTVSKNAVYVGEQTFYTFRLNTQTTVYNYQPPEFNLENSWNEVLAVNQRVRREIDNQNWDAYETRRAVYPLAVGDMTVPEINLKVGVRVRTPHRGPVPFGFDDSFNQDFIDQFFADVTPKSVSMRADALTIHVKPLPQAPLGFKSGVYVPVGATHLTAHTTRDALKAGENLTLEVTVVSVGNLNPLDQLDIALPPGIRIYPEAPKVTQNENNDALIMRKTFRYSLVPIAGGTFTIAPISVNYFDVDTQSYRTAESPAFKFSVEGAPMPEIQPSAPTLAPPRNSPEEQPAPLVEENRFLIRVGESIDPETALYGIAATLLMAMLSLFAIVRRRKRLPLQSIKRKATSCRSIDDLARLYRESLIRSISGKESQFSYEELVVLVKKREFSSKIEFLTLSLLDTFELRRFSGQALDERQLEQLKIETINAISAIIAEQRKRKNDADS